MPLVRKPRFCVRPLLGLRVLCLRFRFVAGALAIVGDVACLGPVPPFLVISSALLTFRELS